MRLQIRLGTPVLLQEARSEYGYSAAGYAAIGAGDQLRIGLRREGEGVITLFPGLR